MQQKSESLSRDLKKHMKDSASALTEFEKALVRKSEECNVSKSVQEPWTIESEQLLLLQELYLRLHQMEKAEEERIAHENNGLSSRIFKRIGSIHIPEGLGIGAGTGRTSGRSSPTSEDEPAKDNKLSRVTVVGGKGAASGTAASNTSSPAAGTSGRPPSGVFGGLRMGKSPWT